MHEEKYNTTANKIRVQLCHVRYPCNIYYHVHVGVFLLIHNKFLHGFSHYFVLSASTRYLNWLGQQWTLR